MTQSLLCPTAKIFPSSLKWHKAIALIVFVVIVSSISPVKPCTVNEHSPLSVPSSGSVSNTLVPSGTLLVSDGLYSIEIGISCSGYLSRFSCDNLISA